jgi:spermidine synthase
MRYYFIAFCSGAAVLVLETVGARLLAPYLGSAYFVWVNIIGVILGALAVGYALGGRLADRRPDALPAVFLLSAVSTALITVERRLLPAIGLALDLRLGSLAASLLLFAPACVLLGMVSPMLVKLATHDLAKLGRSAGALYAVSTAGSIAATFFTGFVLLPHVGMNWIIGLLVAGLVILAAASAAPGARSRGAVVALGLVPLGGVGAEAALYTRPARLVHEEESQYYNIRVVELPNRDGKIQRTLLLDGSPNSATIVGAPAGDLASRVAFHYIDVSTRLIDALKPGPVRMLTIGGGGYTVPEYVKRRGAEADVTVVEIDPAVTRAAQRFFIDPTTPPIRTVEGDGRAFLNTTQGGFNLIYTDAYNGAFGVPAHLCTREAFARLRAALADDGVVLINVDSAIEGPKGRFFRAFWKTFVTSFPHPAMLAMFPKTPRRPQNILMLAAKDDRTFDDPSMAPFEEYRYRRPVDAGDVPLLTDDFAPTDALFRDVALSTFPALRMYWP